MIRIGLLGCGSWGKLILRDLIALGVEVAVVARGEQSRANAERYGATIIADQFDELPEVDGYVVAVPTNLHADFIRLLMPTFKPVFCEKPLTNSLEEARELVGEAGERIFVMDKWRYHAGVLALRDIARSGELGPVQGVKTTRVQWGSPHSDVDMDWILLPHDLTIALEILGAVPEAQYALAERDANDRLVGLSGLLRSDDRWLMFEVGIRAESHRRHIELRCRDGVARLSDAYDSTIEITRTTNIGECNPPAAELRRLSTQMPLLLELSAFVDYLKGSGAPPVSSAADALTIVERIAQLRQLAGLEP